MRSREKVNIYNATWSLFSCQAAIFMQTFSSITVTICLEGKKYLQTRGNNNQSIAIVLFNFLLHKKMKNLYLVTAS